MQGAAALLGACASAPVPLDPALGSPTPGLDQAFAVDHRLSDFAVVVQDAGVVVVQTWDGPFAFCRAPAHTWVEGLDLETGATRWRCDDCGTPYVASGREVVFAAAGTVGASVEYVDAATGASTAECAARDTVPSDARIPFVAWEGGRFLVAPPEAPCAGGVAPDPEPEDPPLLREAVVTRTAAGCSLELRSAGVASAASRRVWGDGSMRIGDRVVRVVRSVDGQTVETLELVRDDGTVLWRREVRTTEPIECCPP